MTCSADNGYSPPPSPLTGEGRGEGDTRIVDFHLYLITDRMSLPAGRELLPTLETALAAGVRAIQLREKDLPASKLLHLALELRELTRRYGARLLINDRIDVALAVDACGVHLGGHSLPASIARKILGPEKLIGVSTHSLDEIQCAAEQGADFVTFGPVYATASKLPFGDPVGLNALQHACATSPLPLFALGGVTAERLGEIRAAGCKRVACIGAIQNGDSVNEVTEKLISSLHE